MTEREEDVPEFQTAHDVPSQPAGACQSEAEGLSGLPPLSLDDLPPPSTRRWVASRKSQVVAAVREGLLTLEEACQRYDLTSEEFGSWQRLIERYGTGGLRVTHLKKFRQPK